MAFLVKYVAFAVAFLSAANLGEGIKLDLVDVTDADSIQAYADMVKVNECETFDPLNPDHMAEIGDDATTLAHLLQVHYGGNNIEICTHKDGDRAWFTTLVALGAWGATTAASEAIGWAVSNWLG